MFVVRLRSGREGVRRRSFNGCLQLASEAPEAILSHAFINNGATGFAFMDEEPARCLHFPLIPLQKPRILKVIDGRPIASGMITHLVRTKL